MLCPYTHRLKSKVLGDYLGLCFGAPLGSYEFSGEAEVGNRWAPTQSIILTVEPASKLVAGKR